MSSCLTWRQQRGPRASPGTGRGDGAHREPLVKVGSAPGAWQGRDEPGRHRAGVGSWRGWGRASQLCSRRWPLRLEMRRELTQGGVNLPRSGRTGGQCRLRGRRDSATAFAVLVGRGGGSFFCARTPLSGIGTELSKFKCNFLKQKKQSRIRQFNLDNGVCKEWLLYLF